jgi:hypothetical protein
MNPHEACSSWVLEKHLLELWRTADGVIRLKGVDTAVIARIVIIEVRRRLLLWAGTACGGTAAGVVGSAPWERSAEVAAAAWGKGRLWQHRCCQGSCKGRHGPQC